MCLAAERRTRRGPLTIHDARTVFDNPWIRLTGFDVSAPSGRRFDYTTVEFKRIATGVVPLHDDGTVMLVGQHRFPLDEYSWELPEGGAEPGEPPLEAIKRELAEEGLLAAAEWRQILKMHLSNSVTDEVAFLFLATGLSPASGERDDTEEDLVVRRMPFGEALAMCEDGRITDSLTVAGLLRVFRMAGKGELPSGLNELVLGR
jgi:8-oxo-dGTP pyrophosphatase MutT (NUDIX family)